MAPKKEKAQKLSLGEFLGETGGVSSWADEVEDSYGTQSFPSTDRRTGPSSYGGGASYGNDRGYHSLRDNLPQELPTKPPYTAHLGNLSYDATVDSVSDFFHDCNVVNVRIIEDREQNRPKGFAYAEFADLEGLKTALTRDGQSFEGRNIRIKVADPPRGGFGDRGAESHRELDWGAKRGPLADIPGRTNRDFGERRPPREFNDERPVREAREMTWERRGPLPPAERPESREGARSRNATDFGSARRASPAAWGEGRQGGDGSRPPRREFSERPERPERAPTAAEKEINWRNNMRPAEPKSHEGSEAPSSPAGGPAALPVGRPKLNLTKRTVSEAPDVVSPAPTSKSSPFGAARPIDTAAREREVEEKRIKDKLEAEEKAKQEKAAKEAAAAEAAEKAKAEEAAAAEAAEKAKADAEAAAAAGTKPEGQEAAAAAEGEQKLPVRTREPREPAPKSRAAESGSWRRAAGDAPSRGAPSGPRRGGAAPRGPRNDGGRPPRSNGTDARGPLSPTAEKAPSSPAVDDDGWTTVTQPVKGRRGGNRPMA
ncbi:putative cytosolic translation initiation factor 4B [Triangularia verruculosa]|uniref:Cytosolic translation initiation factor 4B n=1 Tax=Triangularia verruculosa TaxID=2587418 RepID=A0AAN7AR95_9PEZI|nr:putative cytosolic translation initiation factor 4B [Triangularia verruculosa]